MTSFAAKKDHIYTFITDPSWILSLTHSSLLLQSVGKASTINKYFKIWVEFFENVSRWSRLLDKIEMCFLSIAVSKIYLNMNMEFCLDVVYSLFMFLITFTSSLQKKKFTWPQLTKTHLFNKYLKFSKC